MVLWLESYRSCLLWSYLGVARCSLGFIQRAPAVVDSTWANTKWCGENSADHWLARREPSLVRHKHPAHRPQIGTAIFFLFIRPRCLKKKAVLKTTKCRRSSVWLPMKDSLKETTVYPPLFLFESNKMHVSEVLSSACNMLITWSWSCGSVNLLPPCLPNGDEEKKVNKCNKSQMFL